MAFAAVVTLAPAPASAADGPPRAELQIQEAPAPFPVNGQYTAWSYRVSNPGVLPTPKAVSFTLIYMDSRPGFHKFDKAFSDVHALGTYSDTCTVTTKTFTVTCTLPRLAPGATERITVIGRANIPYDDAYCPSWYASVDAGILPKLVPPVAEQSCTTTISKPRVTTDHVAGSTGSGGAIPGETTRTSPSGQYQFTMQGDGNLVEYGNGKALWASRTSRHPASYFRLDNNGHATVVGPDGTILWTNPLPRPVGIYPDFGIGDDGVLFVEDSEGMLWRNDTARTDQLTAPVSLTADQYLHTGDARLTLQQDGDLVVTVGSTTVWHSGTAGNSGDTVRLQSDGNFVIYSTAGKAIWYSSTGRTGSGNILSLSPAGALTLTHGSKTVWRASE